MKAAWRTEQTQATNVVKLLAGPPAPDYGYESEHHVRDQAVIGPMSTFVYVIDLLGSSELTVTISFEARVDAPTSRESARIGVWRCGRRVPTIRRGHSGVFTLICAVTGTGPYEVRINNPNATTLQISVEIHASSLSVADACGGLSRKLPSVLAHSVDLTRGHETTASLGTVRNTAREPEGRVYITD